jgi:Mce-associated membrane protein
VTDFNVGPETAEAPTSLTEAEEEAARAETRAKEARARAMRLRQQAGTAPSERADEADASSATSRRRWLRRPGRKAMRVAAIVLISASLAASGYIVWQHLTLARQRQHAAEFATAARRGVETMMSIDPDHAKDNVQRVIDNTTGALKSQLEATATYMVKNAQDAKIATKATVEDAAVESMTDNSAVVLVVAKSDTTNADKSKRPPVFWRLSVNIERDGGQLKMSKLDFVQ